jgi:hypothetical protein
VVAIVCLLALPCMGPTQAYSRQTPAAQDMSDSQVSGGYWSSCDGFFHKQHMTFVDPSVGQFINVVGPRAVVLDSQILDPSAAA